MTLKLCIFIVTLSAEFKDPLTDKGHLKNIYRIGTYHSCHFPPIHVIFVPKACKQALKKERNKCQDLAPIEFNGVRVLCSY